jgi:hypothetical protein
MWDGANGITYNHMFGGYIPASMEGGHGLTDGMPVKDFAPPPEPETGGSCP